MERNIIWRYIFKRSSFTKSLRDSFLTFSNFTVYPKHKGAVFYIFYHSSYKKKKKNQSRTSKPIFQNQMELHFTKIYYYMVSLYTELSSHVHSKQILIYMKELTFCTTYQAHTHRMWDSHFLWGVLTLGWSYSPSKVIYSRTLFFKSFPISYAENEFTLPVITRIWEILQKLRYKKSH